MSRTIRSCFLSRANIALSVSQSNPHYGTLTSIIKRSLPALPEHLFFPHHRAIKSSNYHSHIHIYYHSHNSNHPHPHLQNGKASRWSRFLHRPKERPWLLCRSEATRSRFLCCAKERSRFLRRSEERSRLLCCSTPVNILS